ncbi:NAD(P)H-quinone oxidoreductase chain 4, chloroplastic [Quillaja saponaria]|uniref:NAD(P)H-quinone oxidoreductase chain 4, chloroplastic n=1 Tax=Quillaja saponaria TaxID=32244 RepID=A0AAD7KK25_QUISA|nr:NAD(P)H-quinone oxidoreductase chain 4, chloroplastic [Quillaja saponaria]
MGLNGAILQIISHGFIGAALFFLAGTSYDRIRLLYLEEMGGMAIPIPKIFTMFSILSMASLALPGMSGDERFYCGIDSLFWNNYQSKISFNDKNTNYFCNGNWNDINSYLFIIYVTPDVLRIQAF